MSQSPEGKRMETPTDALIVATEEADRFKHVFILALTNDGNIYIAYNTTPLSTRLGMLRFATLDQEAEVLTEEREDT